MFSKDELNAIGLIVSQAATKGSDASFIAALLAKIKGLIDAPDADTAAAGE